MENGRWKLFHTSQCNNRSQNSSAKMRKVYAEKLLGIAMCATISGDFFAGG
jgi:hypothetical protein